MNIDKLTTDDAILTEIGRRLAGRRISMQMTQAQLADAAGVSKRTVERFENGESAQFLSVIRMFRALDLLPSLDAMIPGETISPLDAVKRSGKVRKRVSTARKPGPTSAWEWKDKQ